MPKDHGGKRAQQSPSGHDWTPDWEWTQSLRRQKSFEDEEYRTRVIYRALTRIMTLGKRAEE